MTYTKKELLILNKFSHWNLNFQQKSLAQLGIPFVLEAVKNNVEALVFASNELQNNP